LSRGNHSDSGRNVRRRSGCAARSCGLAECRLRGVRVQGSDHTTPSRIAQREATAGPQHTENAPLSLGGGSPGRREPWAAGALGGGSPGPGSQNAAYGAFVFKGLIIPPPRATPGREQPNQPVGDFRVFAGGTRGARKKPADRAGGGHAGCREIDTGGSVSDHTRTPARRAHGARGSVASGLPVSNEPTKKRPPYRAGSG